MTATTIDQLAMFGPEQCAAHTSEQAREMCRRLARSHEENFTVLSAVVPPELTDDFAAVYAFCRWADDLGDEAGDPERSQSLLAWWRRELHACFEGEPRHPVFTALRPVITRHQLPMKPFDDLIIAFEMDQQVTRYQTWAQLLDYCRLSANPVGRLVLMLCGEPRDEAIFARSDEICTALQLTNHWQDVRRDLLDRNRIYIPREFIAQADVESFEHRLRQSAMQGYGVDRQLLSEYRALLRTCVEKTWPMYDTGSALLHQIGRKTTPIVWLLSMGGQHALRLIEMWNYETILHRPRLSALTKASLIARAWWMARRSRAK